MLSEKHKITEDGFGIHTFELMYSCIYKKEYKRLRKRFCYINNYLDSNEKYYVGDNYTYLNLYDDGIRIYLNCDKSKFYSIRVIITPRTLIDGSAEATSISRKDEDYDEIESRLYHKLCVVFGNEFDLGRFKLSRVDCCVNIMLPECYSAEKYIRLIRRSMVYNYHAKVITYGDVDKDRHSFRIITGNMTFTAYDKYYQLNDANKNYDAVSDSLLRLEIALNRDIIYEIELNAAIIKLSAILRQIAWLSESVFVDYIDTHFLYGDYYCIDEMRSRIENSNLSNKTKEYMRKCTDIQFNRNNYPALKEHLISMLGSRHRYRKMLEGFADIEMSPVSMPQRCNNEEKMLPGLHRILGM